MAYNIGYISKFSSINFEEKWKPDFDEQKEYVQLFSAVDEIQIQAIYTDSDRAWALDDIYCVITNLKSEDEAKVYATSTGISWGDNLIINFNLTDTIPLEGLYEIKLRHGKFRFGLSYIRIVEETDERLCNTLKIKYTNRINYFDAAFINQDETVNHFSFRIEGGFEESEKQFKVSNNSSRDQRYLQTQLSALPYRIKKMTVGSKKGVPEWVGDKINLILSCSGVTINGVEHVRSEGAEPEISVLKEYYPLFVYKIDVEEIENYKTETVYIEEFDPVQEVALQFTGSQYIDSGVFQRGDIHVRMKARIYYNPANADNMFWGSGTNLTIRAQQFGLILNSGIISFRITNNTLNINTVPASPYIDGNFHDFEWNNGRLTIDGTIISYTNSYNSNPNSTLKHFIGAENNLGQGGAVFFSIMDLQEIEFRDAYTNQLLFYGYTVKAGDEINGNTAAQNCLYDEVSNSFKLPNIPINVITI